MANDRGLECANCGSDDGCDQTIKHKERKIPKRMTHELKCDTRFYDAVANGQKNFEVRRADRPFEVGDTLKLQATLHGAYVGPYCFRQIVYILSEKDAEEYGVCAGFCVLGLR
jgi:hypothetical protein